MNKQINEKKERKAKDNFFTYHLTNHFTKYILFIDIET